MAGLNHAERAELGALSEAEACGMGGVEGKCRESAQKHDCEGRVPCGD